MSDRIYPDFISTYLDYTSGHEATKRVHLWSIVSVIAAALERKVWLDRGYYTLYPNLYVFIIGKSGLVKKSTSTAVAVNLFRELPKARLMSERLTAGSLVQQMNMAGKKFQVGGDGETKAQSPVFAYASELSVLLTEVFGSITELLTTFYDCIPQDSSKPWVYSTVGRGDLNIYGPCLNILGCSTQAWLRRCIPSSEQEGGFSSRVIFVVENGGPDKFVAWPEVSPELDLTRMKLVSDLKQIYSLSGVFQVEPDAKEAFRLWYEYHMREVIPMNGDPKMAGYNGRKGDLMLKLAMVRAASLGDALVITKEHIMWAGLELENLEHDMRSAFQGFNHHAGELTFDLRNYIRNRKRVSKPELIKVFAVKHPGNAIITACQDLIDLNEIEQEETTKDGVKQIYYKHLGSPFL